MSIIFIFQCVTDKCHGGIGSIDIIVTYLTLEVLVLIRSWSPYQILPLSIFCQKFYHIIQVYKFYMGVYNK